MGKLCGALLVDVVIYDGLYGRAEGAPDENEA